MAKTIFSLFVLVVLVGCKNGAGNFPLALLIDWQGDSDNMYSMLVGYVGDTLKIVYADPNPGGIKELHRKDKWTITGQSFGEDELTGDRNILCPLTISLQTGEGEIGRPDVSVLLFETAAKESIRVSFEQLRSKFTVSDAG